MTRVPTYVSGQILLNRIIDIQGAHFDSTLQVNSRKKAKRTPGCPLKVFRLISLETIRERADRFNSGNILAEVRAKATQESANDIERNAQSIIANIREGAKFKTDEPSSEYIASLRQMRKNVVGSLAQVRDTLNIDLEGRFLFAGGREQTPPVEMPVSSFTEFLDTYDGNNVTFPKHAPRICLMWIFGALISHSQPLPRSAVPTMGHFQPQPQGNSSQEQLQIRSSSQPRFRILALVLMKVKLSPQPQMHLAASSVAWP